MGQKIVRLGSISDELQEHLWNQLPSENTMKIAGKILLCLGMPVMIRNNFATELCITRGQEGYVCGWQSTLGSKNQQVLDTLFVKLKDPPKNIKFDDLPDNVVPIPKPPYQLKYHCQMTQRSELSDHRWRYHSTSQ